MGEWLCMRDRKTKLGDLRLTKENYNEVELILNQYIQINGEISLSIKNETVLSEYKKIKEIRIYEFNNFLRLELRKSNTDILSPLDIEKIHLSGEVIDYEIGSYIHTIVGVGNDVGVSLSNVMTNFMKELEYKYNKEKGLECTNYKD